MNSIHGAHYINKAFKNSIDYSGFDFNLAFIHTVYGVGYIETEACPTPLHPREVILGGGLTKMLIKTYRDMILTYQGFHLKEE